MPTRMLYSVPNNSTVQKMVRSDTGTPCQMRAPGESTGTLSLEISMDELAYALKMDPIELRLKNYADRDEEEESAVVEQEAAAMLSAGRGSLRMVEEADGAAVDAGGKHADRVGHGDFGISRETAAGVGRARLNADGSMLVEAGTQDIGTGTYTVMTQIAAATMGMHPSRVTFLLGDTRYPETPRLGRVGNGGDGGFGGAADDARAARESGATGGERRAIAGAWCGGAGYRDRERTPLHAVTADARRNTAATDGAQRTAADRSHGGGDSLATKRNDIRPTHSARSLPRFAWMRIWERRA